MFLIVIPREKNNTKNVRFLPSIPSFLRNVDVFANIEPSSLLRLVFLFIFFTHHPRNSLGS